MPQKRKLLQNQIMINLKNKMSLIFLKKNYQIKVTLVFYFFIFFFHFRKVKFFSKKEKKENFSTWFTFNGHLIQSPAGTIASKKKIFSVQCLSQWFLFYIECHLLLFLLLDVSLTMRQACYYK